MEKKKIISIEDRIPRLKEARKKKANRRLLFYLSVFFFLISIIVYLQSPLSHIKEIHVSGNEVIPDQDIVQVSELTTSTNIWTINNSEVRRKLDSVALIESANVTRNLPWTVELSIKEHDVIGYLHDEANYYPVLENGNVLAESKYANLGEAPLLSSFTDEQYLNRMAKELGNLPNSILNLISEVIWTPSEKNKYKIVLYMNDGFIVEATIRDFSNKMKSYPSIVSQLDDDAKGIIHMSVGSYFEKID